MNTLEQINAGRQDDKQANPARYCRVVGCLLFANGGDTCANHRKTAEEKK